MSMKTNKLKSLPIAACCFVIALFSGAQGMDNPTGIEEKTCIELTRMRVTSQNEIDALDFGETSSHAINFQNYSGYFSSYLFSQLESTRQLANLFATMVINRPRLAVALGFAYLAPQVLALCECYGCYATTPDGYECTTWYAGTPGVSMLISRSPTECARAHDSNLTLCLPYPK
jgi:hypothetical protein